MEVYDILKEDHELASKLIAQIEAKSSDDEARREVFVELKNELILHMWVEEMIFYPAIESFDATREKVAEGINEHHEAKALLEELDDLWKDDAEWLSKFEALKKSIQHHVQEEETQVFPKAKQVLSADFAEELGAQVTTEKAQRRATP